MEFYPDSLLILNFQSDDKDKNLLFQNQKMIEF